MVAPRRKAVAATVAAACALSPLAGAGVARAAATFGPLPPARVVARPPSFNDLVATGLLPAAAAKASIKAKATLPVSVNLTAYAMPPGDQGGLGSCVAWAVDYGLLGWYANRYGRLPQLTKTTSDYLQPMMGFHYFGVPTGAHHKDAPYAGEPVRDSAYIDEGFKQLGSYAVAPASQYHQEFFSDYFHYPSAAEIRSAAKYRIKPSLRTRLFSHWNTNATQAELDLIKSELSQQRPVVLGIVVGPYFATYEGGILNSENFSAKTGGHAILAVGYNSKSLLLQNSWGSDWGENGYIRVSWQHAMKIVKEAEDLKSTGDPFVMPKGTR